VIAECKHSSCIAAGLGTLNSKGLRFTSKADVGCCLKMMTAASATVGIWPS
jgi:hypothetical protein